MVHFYKVILFISLIFTYPALGISVSVNSNCSNGAIPFNFSQYSFDPDFKIKISLHDINADYIFKEVTSKYGADIVVENNISVDFSVCKSYRGKTIKISDYEYDPDLTIKISNDAYDSDFTIYNNSILSIEEAISILLIPGYSLLEKK